MQNEVLEIAEFNLNSTTRTLVGRDGKTVSLNWKNFSVLKLLLENQNDIVDRNKLIKDVWEDNFPVGDKALTTAIWHLRKAFENSSVTIETIPKKGYRLSVSLNASQQFQNEQDQSDYSDNSNNVEKASIWHNRLSLSILFFLALGGASLSWWYASSLDLDSTNSVAANSTSMTDKTSRQIALFSRGDINSVNTQVFLQQIETQIHNKAALELLPAISKKALLNSDSRRQLAQELKVSSLVYVEVTEMPQGLLNVSVKVEQVNGSGFGSRSWTVSESELPSLVPSIIAMLPANDWQ